MVSLKKVQKSNSRVASSLEPGAVAVFVGGTRGIGEMTAKQFAQHTRQPRIYFVGRSQEDGNRVTAECKKLNPDGEYIFISADVSLIRAVDQVCQQIKGREKPTNLLFLTQGTLATRTKTDEGLHLFVALPFYSRTRFVVNLLPLLQQATGIRRVVSVLAAGKEGRIDASDFQAWKVPLTSLRGQSASLVTLSLEALAKKAPNVSFVHSYPGFVKTNLAKGLNSAVINVMQPALFFIGSFLFVPEREVGERHLFLATSARYPPANPDGIDTCGVPVSDGVPVARGSNGREGSGVYNVDQVGECASPEVTTLLAKLRKEGMVEQVWEHVEKEFERITGS